MQKIFLHIYVHKCTHYLEIDLHDYVHLRNNFSQTLSKLKLVMSAYGLTIAFTCGLQISHNYSDRLLRSATRYFNSKVISRNCERKAAMVWRPRLITIPGILCAVFLMASFSWNFSWPNLHKPNDNAVLELQIPPKISWRPKRSSDAHLGSEYGKIWESVPSLHRLLPFASPRASFPPPVSPDNGFLFATIRGEFHEIHASICDFVVIARLLNATLVLPKIHDIEAPKRSRPKVQKFSYLYNEQHFITTLADDVRVVRTLPKKLLHSKTQLKKLSVKSPLPNASLQYYLDEVTPELRDHGACGFVFTDGRVLQSLLPAELGEYQRLRCRVAFHALRLREEIEQLGFQLVRRLEEQGRPYLAVHFGLEKDVLARDGCAELFQDLQAESIQTQRSLLLRTGEISGELHIDSHKQRYKDLCPLMPFEVGNILESLGYEKDTQIYLTGTEMMGGQRLLFHLRSMYNNLHNRFTLSTFSERKNLTLIFEEPPTRPSSSSSGNKFGDIVTSLFEATTTKNAEMKKMMMSTVEGWWRSVGECGEDTEDIRRITLVEQQEQGHRLLWAALDFLVALEANAFFPAYDQDRHGRPNFASLVMGHRLYTSPSLKTFRPNRSRIFGLLEKHLNSKETSWMSNLHHILLRSLEPEALDHAFLSMKPQMFIAHPLPECACKMGPPSLANESQAVWRDLVSCPS